MTPALAFPRTSSDRVHRARTVFLIWCFHAGLVLLYLPTPVAGTPGLVLLVAALLLNLMFAPLECALGVLGFAFVAASTQGLAELFATLRWVCLGAAAVILPVRFFFRKSTRRPAVVNRFDYLMATFLVVAATTVFTSLAASLSALKLTAMMCLFYVVSLAGRQLVELYGPAAPRHLVTGLLAFTGAIIALPLAGTALRFGPVATLRGWFAGYQGNPNAWAVLVGTALAWMSVPLIRRARWWGARHWALLGGVAVVFYSLLWSGSRAGLLSVAVSATILCLVHANRRIGSLLAVITLLFAARSVSEPNFIPNLIRQYVLKHARGQVDLLQSRREPWKMVQQRFEQHPWLGMGFGISTESQSAWAIDVSTGSSIVETGSSIWAALSQVGVVGAAVLFTALLGLLIHGARFCWQVRDPWFTALYASVAALTVNALFEGWLLAPGNFACVYYWIQCFFLNSLMCRYRARPHWAPPAAELRAAAALVSARSSA